MDNVPQNETPTIVKSAFNSVAEVVSAYGWTILFLLVIANLVWSHIQPKLRRWRDAVEEQRQARVFHENPDLAIRRQESLAKARQRFQDELDKLVNEHAEKVKEREERKIQEKIMNWEKIQQGNSSGSTLSQSRPNSSSSTLSQSRPNSSSSTLSQSRPNSSNDNSLRGGYNPLMNTGGGACYRPSRRAGGGGGGG